MDVLRGLTIAFMILVNDPGDWRRVFPPLQHAEWSGWTPTDLVFPTFLFLVGCSLVFSVNARLRRGTAASVIAWQMVRRSALIFGIQIVMGLLPFFQISHLRLFGVLARIALCYLAAGLLYLALRRARGIAVCAAILLVGYWVLLRFVPVPGFGMPVRDVPLLDQVGNLTSWIDRGFTAWTQHWLHVGVLYRKTSDPEGILSTLPAIATTLVGVVAGSWLASSDSRGEDGETRKGSALPLFFAAFGCLLAGELWNSIFPINKNLWTSSFVLLAAGFSLLGLAVMHWAFDIREMQHRSRAIRSLSWPLLVFGSNALVAYIVSEVIVELTTAVHYPGASPRVTLLGGVYQHLFAWRGSTEITSLLFAIAYVLFCFLPNWLLWRKRIFVRV